MLCRAGCIVAVTLASCWSPLAAEDWPQFRGPDGQGHADETPVPLTWSETANVAWRTPIEGRGWSSPIVVGEQVWLTTAIESAGSLRAVVLHRQSGEVLYDIEVFRKEDLGRINAKNSHASPTPVSDGQFVYVHFGAQGTACLSTDGQIVWRTELAYGQHHGPGASPILWRGLLIVSCDGVDAQYVIALDKRSGRPVWQKHRQGKNAYTTPLVIEHNGAEQLIAAGGDGVWSYDPKNGQELWHFSYEGHSVIPRPVYRDGLLYVCSGYWTPSLYALRVDGRGDITTSHRVFTVRRGVPFTPSPLLIDDRLILLSDRGIATAIDPKSGQELWSRRLGGNYSASPVYAQGRIYLLSEEGVATVLSAEGECEQLAVNELPGQALASPAVADGAIFLRTDEAVYCLRESHRANRRSLAGSFEIMDAPLPGRQVIRR